MRGDSFCEGLRANWIRVGSTISTERLLSDRRHGLFCNRRFTGFDRGKKKKRKEKKLSQRGNLIWFRYKYPFLSIFPFPFYLFIRIWKFYSNMENFIILRRYLHLQLFKIHMRLIEKGNVFCCYSFLIYIDLSKLKLLEGVKNIR